MKHLSILVLSDQGDTSTVSCIAGTYEVFKKANAFWARTEKEPLFTIELVGVSSGDHIAESLFSVKTQKTIDQIASTDLIIVPSTMIRSYEEVSSANQQLMRWVASMYKQGAQIATMCSGAFLLASTGLLDGKNCSTHWSVSEKFRFRFPEINLQTDKLITDENGIYTNGGAFSFLNFLIYLIEKFYDRPTALHCAKVLQIDLDRHLQAEFSIFNGHKKHDDDVILDAQTFLEDNYRSKISIEDLSSKFNVGRRNFDRRFIRATGITPLDYLQRLKIEAAKKSLENCRKSVGEIMYDVGYNDTKSFREVFRRVTGMSPLDYKVKYGR